jgi:hypothetical protein
MAGHTKQAIDALTMNHAAETSSWSNRRQARPAMRHVALDGREGP